MAQNPLAVFVKHPTLGRVLINKSDFVPGQHELFEDGASAPAPEVSPDGDPRAEAKQVLQSLNVEDLTIALQEASDLAAVALAEEAENERGGGPRKGALRAIAERRAQLEAQG